MDRRKALKQTGWLAGTALTMPSLLSLLQSCATEDRRSYVPLFFTSDEAKTVAALVDTILPRTETPGALDVNVDVFLDKVVAETYDAAGQEQMRANLADFIDRCQSQQGAPFFELDQDGKTAFLRAEEQSSGQFNPGVWGTTVGEQGPIGFYRAFKSMALWAYFSSEEIGKNVLNYDPIPGPFLPCIPVAEVGNKWTLG